MLTILGALIGFLGSALPTIVGYFTKKADNNYNIELAKINAASENSKLDIERLKAAVEQGDSLRQHDSALDGGVFFNALRASIRPVVTYAFFALFITVKSTAAYLMIVQGYSIPDMVMAVWDDETSGLFSLIVSFWFGEKIFR